MSEDRANYIPALRYKWLTGFYDTVMEGMMRETEFKQALVRQARVAEDYQAVGRQRSRS
jgi:hypothetical protein